METICHLPLELYDAVFQWLDLTEILILRNTCKLLSDVISRRNGNHVICFQNVDHLEESIDNASNSIAGKLSNAFLQSERTFKLGDSQLVRVEEKQPNGETSYIASAIFATNIDFISKVMCIHAKSRIKIFTGDLETSVRVIESCQPSELQISSSEFGMLTEYFDLDLSVDRQRLCNMIERGVCIDFLADGTIGFSFESLDDKFLFSEPPHDISISSNIAAERQYEISGCERGRVLVSLLDGENPNVEQVALDLASYLKMLMRRWRDLTGIALKLP
ncbi:hypothetical protein HDU97_001237 [Phlyctochytrium planicorne]|nr:hypothetical protein HDU97_001237 [Phlyctochytrium planicorne]